MRWPATQLRKNGSLGLPGHRRAALLATILVAHGALIAVVIVNRAGSQPARPEPARLVTFDIKTPEPVVAARVIPMPSVPALIMPPVPIPVLVQTPPSDAVDETASSAGGGCDLTDTVQAALRGNPLARAAVASLPVTFRSVANAVMLWDGQWVAPAGNVQSQGAQGIIRTVVLGVVASASPECRAQVQAGPRLIVMPGTPDVTLALGSGRWRWQDIEARDPAPLPGRRSPTVILASNGAPQGADDQNYSAIAGSRKSGRRSGT